MARRAPPEAEVEGFNLTPMIDIVFQLMIFFMLVVDMSRAQTEPVRLPAASRAVDRKEEVVVVHLLPDGTVRVNGRTLWRPAHGDDNSRMEAFFGTMALSAARREHPVLIRADRSTSFEHLQKLLMIASSHGGVTKVQFAAMKE